MSNLFYVFVVFIVLVFFMMSGFGVVVVVLDLKMFVLVIYLVDNFEEF